MKKVLLLALLLLNIHPGASTPKGVTASLKAKWSMTPFLLETSEFVGEDGNDKFWQFVETVKELTVYKQGESVRSYYNLIIKKAGQFLTDLQVHLLRFALSMRSYSPAVHAAQQIASDEPPPVACPAFVSVHGEHSCSTKDIKKLLKAAAGRPKPYLYKNDHTYPGVNQTDVPVVILYAEIGTKKFSSFHKVLSEKAEEGVLIYVLRHFVADPKPQKVLLSGYGVELAIKSTEYKAVDDTKVKDSKTVLTAEDDDDEVQGFVFAKLKKSHPELQEELGELRKHLLESTSDMAPLKVWEMQDSDGMTSVTMWIVGDLEKVSGRKLLLDALKHVKSSPGVRIGVINNPSGKPREDNTMVYRAVWASLLTQKNKAAAEFVLKLLKEESSQLLQQGTKMKDLLMQGMDVDAFEKKFNTLEVDFILSQQLFCRDVLKLRPGLRAVISNGRILGPFEEQDEFTVEDFHLLQRITLGGSAEKVKANVKQMGMKPKHASDLVMKVDALLAAAPKGEVRRDVQFKDTHSVLHLSPRENEVFYDVVAIVDPLTRVAQKISSLLIVLTQVVNARLQVFMNCRAKLSEMPLKSFYRFVLEPDVTFLANETVSSGPVARFMELPESPLLTLNMITPESWMVQAVSSPHDLDNIHLQEVNGVVAAEFELEHLLLEGHCFDLSTGQPPRGLQFTLGSSRDLLMYDTIVMANLGYFQLKANPGAWILRLRKGRSEEIYQILTHDGTDSPADAGDVVVVLNSFHSKIIKVRVQKKTEKINEDLLSETSESKGIWDSIVSVWSTFEKSITGGGSKKDDGEKKKEDVLNIFSVASGHLYERFLRIMMLSVLRHTNTPVKFWFLKNYLSPSFKETISHMAQSYGFQYELVQYKWPRWLHQQTEKQRIIWGYKILFLDVLFPLAVDKIIFVDADQIVRADLKELKDLDLEGAPYGYTPFCDSRREMEGYRFWKTGYWASHLGHRKYHISALYIVDLKKFRKIAAGDRLRGQYQALSQDPNSLSNLDQDLPNNMIHQVAIKSLPQEWLWCETWCDDASKVTAKTIDLCNNPKTKEPKLTAAARIVPEWVEYDNEIKELLGQIQKVGDTATKKQTLPPSQHEKADKRRDEL
ncbi:UDP-glucose:glycoprotein glucosyltransferase 2 [Nematolebias whitei]|uniref:UDP-glucose:glycoprotein glucosyltransferase 2 n=1 Tax=Nematolebias whitei TaxID=451745 RepID=UPI00189BCF3A|nr:UDP-glucose:glycoprotein glucosyltransferase 2 [Nematolebias whitei]